MSAVGVQEPGACGARCWPCAALRAAVPRAAVRLGLERLALEHVAETARIRFVDAHAHVHGDLTGLVGAAYLESAGGLQRGFASSARCAPTPRDGLRFAVRWLLTTLADDPARAAFCYVEILKGGPALIGLREQIRRSSIDLWAIQHRHATPEQWLPRSHFELVNSAAISLIATRAAQGRTEELRDMLEAVLSLIEPGGPAVPVLSLVS